VVFEHKLAAALLLAAIFLCPAVVAQEDRKAIELTRAAVQANRHEIVQMAMNFSPSELESFKPVYREWRAKTEALGDRKVKLVTAVFEKAESLTDDQARKMMDEWLDLQADDLKLKREYVAKFRKILPETKVARFFQLENKLDSALLYNLAGTVPMVEP
jgi:hypothetical protein